MKNKQKPKSIIDIIFDCLDSIFRGHSDKVWFWVILYAIAVSLSGYILGC